MATLADLYAFLEIKMDTKSIDSAFPWDSFKIEERNLARLEILTWWNIERLVEDNDCPIDKGLAIQYFDNRIKDAKNQFLIYRYGYFTYLLSNNNVYAKKALDALLSCVKGLLPEDKSSFPFNASNAIETLLALSKVIKYRIQDVEKLVWEILDSDYGFRTKLNLLEKAKECNFFRAADAAKIAKKCQSIYPDTDVHWNENCCKLGLFFAAKIQSNGNTFVSFFNETLGDIEMAKIKNPEDDPNNIAVPHLNDTCLEKAMEYYKDAGATKKMREASRQYAANKKKLKYIPITSSKKTDERIVAHYKALCERLINGKISDLMWNLAIPESFVFPSLKALSEMPQPQQTTWESLGFIDKQKDINGNTQITHQQIQTRLMYETWLLHVVRHPVLNVLLTAVEERKLTYAKLKSWLLKETCFGTVIECTKGDQQETTTWFSQIDYAFRVLLQQYQKVIQDKPADWRVPVDGLSIRFEGFLRIIVSECGGQTTKLDHYGGTTEFLLDDLLRDTSLQRVFTEDDIDFFEYVFTSKGFNIRNSVAHAFYIPQDYNIMKATLVFLCILRLAKFNPDKGR